METYTNESTPRAVKRAGLLVAAGLVAVAVVFAAYQLKDAQVLDQFKMGEFDVTVTR